MEARQGWQGESFPVLSDQERRAAFLVKTMAVRQFEIRRRLTPPIESRLNSYILSGKHEGAMSIPERVNAFLTAQRPNRFCDDCIAENLEFRGRREVRQATSALGTTDSFHRAQGVCSTCGKEKRVIQRLF